MGAILQRAPTDRMSRRVWLFVDLAVKALLVGILLFAVLNTDLPRFAGKAMGARALTYPLAAVVTPLGWWLFARRRAFPFHVDILIVLPFLIDTTGNALNLYDTIDWWDDANHFVNWAILTTAFLLAIRSFRLAALNVALLGIGFGATTAILWEIGEYITFIRDSTERSTAYTDTLGDLGLGLSGSVVASIIVVLAPSVLRRTLPWLFESGR